MTVSIIICTRNRAESLRPTLVSIGKVTVPQGWIVELLVVDNGSTDQTATVARDAQLDKIGLRYINEPKVGMCFARNAGLSATSGEIIMFTDDDVRVPSNWVAAMCEPIANETADAVAGGIVFPVEYTVALSVPVISSHRSWFASTEELDPDRPLFMIGANMAFHRRVLSKVPEFDVELGPGALGFGDETLFSFQLLAAGYRLIAVFDISVEHYFDLARLKREALINLARKKGASHAYLFHHWEHKRSQLVVPRLILSHLRQYWSRFFGGLTGKTEGDISDQDLRLEEDLAFYREYIVQRRRGFKYLLRSQTRVDSSRQ